MFGFVKVVEKPKMTIADAIRKGASIRPQAIGLFFENGRSCALMAAYEGVTGKKLSGLAFWDTIKMPFVLKHRLGISFKTMGDVIEWNDANHFSRERIANILEGRALENKLR